MKSYNVTVTQGRMKQAFSNSIGQIVKNETAKIVKEAIENSKISVGVVTKFYPYLDKAEVQILNSDKKVLCKILHRFGGELIDFYTPNGDFVYDNEMKEKCIIPRGDLNCLVVDINSFDDEYLLLGYYNIDELIGINPASQGNLKICTEGGTNEFFIKFGYDGLDIRLPETFSIDAGNFDEEMISIRYAESDTVYTKVEVDEKIGEITDINIDGLVTLLSNWFQDKLVSGTNIKTVNNQSLLGSGNITIEGGGGSVDSTWITGSTNPAESQLIQSALSEKADNEDIPTNLSDLNNDEGFVTQNHTHSIEDTDLFSVLDCVNDNFDDLSDGNYIILLGSD